MTSDGLPRVTEMLLEDVGDLRALCLTAKGFWTNPEGRITLLPDAIRAIAADKGVSLPRSSPLAAPSRPMSALLER